MIKSKQNPGTEKSAVIMTEVVFPNDTNPLGILRGGKILDWMDTASAICAQTHANRIAVTAAIDKVSFNKPVKLGDIVTLKAVITRVFRTSMEVYVSVWARRIPQSGEFLSNEAYYTFVALNEQALPVEIPKIVPGTPAEKRRYAEALERYNKRKQGTGKS